MISAFRRVISTDYEKQRIQDNVALVLKQISTKEILDGVLVTCTVSSSATTVNHTLGRAPQGWIIVDKLAVGDIIRTAWDERTITLVSSAASTPITLWVF